MKLAIADRTLRMPLVEAMQSARTLGYDGVEVCVDRLDGNEHPVLAADGGGWLKEQAEAAGVAVASISAGVLSRHSLFSTNAAACHGVADLLQRLLEACRTSGADTLHLPLHGASEPHHPGERQRTVEALRPLVRQAEAAGITLALECIEPADAARGWAASLKSPSVKLAFDVGNARAAGFDVAAELQARQGLLQHIRLRDRSGREPFATVQLGQGAVDWPAAAQVLARAGFTGWGIVVLPVEPENRTEAARQALELLRSLATPADSFLDPPSAPI
jgi:sugar phosphate isomerase/epimerase